MKLDRALNATLLLAILLAWTPLFAQESAPDLSDPFIWLEDAHSPKALEWVKAQDDSTMAVFGKDPNFEKFRQISLEILNSKDRIPYGSYDGKYVYNFWKDQAHRKGIVRRATIDEYVKPEPKWETVLDIDSLSAREGKDYVYEGSVMLPPDMNRGMVGLSIGGTDAAIYREFDYTTKSFVKDGFVVPDAKSNVDWYDANTLIVGTDFGPGSMTTSGYPRIAKLWKRGTPLSDATTILEGDSTDVSVSAYMSSRPEGDLFFIRRGTSFWEATQWLVHDDGTRVELPFPKDSYGIPFKGRILVKLNSDWLGIPEGSLVALKISDLQAPDLEAKVETILTPDNKSTIEGVDATADYIIASLLDNVRGKLLYFTLDSTGGHDVWTQGEVAAPDMGTISISSSSSFNNILMFDYEDFLTPSKLYLCSDPKSSPEEIKSLPMAFDTTGLQAQQFFATSTDGTAVPYFIIGRKDMKLDGSNPTLLYGYGGFRSSETPFYSKTVGKIWLSNGGVYVLANIRGGGEFGPRWHKAGILEKRQQVFDDFISVGEDLIKRKITSSAHLGIEGGSNGGLLVGAVFVERPDLCKAVVCQVPLLDMIRYTKIGAGASWIGEYGDPEKPDQRAYIEKYSPYQNVKSGVAYPEVLFETSTTDDRVSPAHARKMAAKMEAMGDQVYFYEETTGGHAAAADNTQTAHRYALEYTYLWKMLK